MQRSPTRFIRKLRQDDVSFHFKFPASRPRIPKCAFVKVVWTKLYRVAWPIRSHSLSVEQQLWLNFGKDGNPPKKRTGHAPPLFFWSHWNWYSGHYPTISWQHLWQLISVNQQHSPSVWIDQQSHLSFLSSCEYPLRDICFFCLVILWASIFESIVTDVSISASCKTLIKTRSQTNFFELN